ncbi:MAG TPA: trypsin-like peptidase domain-containing protein [Gemmatimonadales bacterium]|nr:trypsin-like peptidase domain-containing protein [Gemmatimonadales bacterium]
MSEALARELARVADALRRVTVEIRAPRGPRGGLGAGVVWPEPQVVVTNAHVVGARSGALVCYADGREVEGRVVRLDVRRDLAAIAVPGDGHEAATLGDAAGLRPGELVLALGHPLGAAGALAVGVVHAAAGRWIRADVRLAPGNSGGPLADAAGRVVGVNAMIARGLGLAVPASVVGRFLQARDAAPRLGVAVRPVVLARGRGLGLLVLEIAPHGAAAQAGLCPGDVLVALDRRPFTSASDLPAELTRARPDAELLLEIVRGGTRLELAVRLPGRAATEAA